MKRSVSLVFLFAVLFNFTAGASDSKEGPLAKGNSALERKEYLAALQWFNEAISTDPCLADAYLGSAKAHRALGRLDEAITDCRRLLQLDPKQADYYFYLACLYNEKGNPNAATEVFTDAIRLSPDNLIFYSGRAGMHLSCGNYDLAIVDLNKVIEFEPNNVDAYHCRAEAFTLQKDYNRAILDYGEVIRLNPKATEAYDSRSSLFLRCGRYSEAMADLDEAIRQDPNNVMARTNRAACHYRRKEYEQAMVDYNAAIALKPNSSFLYERRGAFWIERGKYTQGISDLKMAIQLDPDDTARDYKATSDTPLEMEALEHGHNQVRQMLQDRPNMGQYGTKADWLYKWAARKFAGEDLGRKIFWNSVEPPRSTGACNQPFPIAQIRINRKTIDGPDRGKDCPFEELWRRAVFELYNVTNDDFMRLKKEATDGKLAKREYVIGMIKAESVAAQKTRAFYIHAFLPWACEHQVTTHPVSWYIAWGLGINDNRLGQLPEEDKNWSYFERSYDRITLHRLTKEGNYQQAVEFADKIYKDAETPDECATIQGFQGYSFLQMDKLEQAIKCYSEVIRLDPRNANPHMGRSDAYRKLGKMDLALADSNEAIRLEPNNPDCYRVRSYVYYDMGDKDRANADFSTFRRLKKTSTRKE